MLTLCTSTSTNCNGHTAKFQLDEVIFSPHTSLNAPACMRPNARANVCLSLPKTLQPLWHNMITNILYLSGSHLQVVALRNGGLVLGVSVHLCRPITTRGDAGPQQPGPLGSLISSRSTAISARCPGLSDQVDATDLIIEANDLCSSLRTCTRQLVCSLPTP